VAKAGWGRPLIVSVDDDVGLAADHRWAEAPRPSAERRPILPGLRLCGSYSVPFASAKLSSNVVALLAPLFGMALTPHTGPVDEVALTTFGDAREGSCVCAFTCGRRTAFLNKG
jgi:hypothetical protein